MVLMRCADWVGSVRKMTMLGFGEEEEDGGRG